MATVEVSFTPLPAHVRTARLVATAVARRGGVPESLLDEVRLAVGEACSRAVEEHQMHCPAVPVHIRLMRDAERFEVTVTDAAPLAVQARAQANGGHSANGTTADNGSSGAAGGAATAGTTGGAATTGAAGGPAAVGATDGAATAGAAANGAQRADTGADATSGDLPDDEAWSSGVGMAVITGLADDVRVTRTDAGLAIAMTWNCRASSDSVIR